MGRANEQKSSAYVGCATDHQNGRVILPQQGQVIWVPVVIAGQDNHGNPILFQRLQEV
jgi:hypothetical protein